MRDTFNMEHSRHPDSYDIKKPFMKLSRMTFLMLLVIFICSLIAVALLVYNFAVCPQDESERTCGSQYHNYLNGNVLPTNMPTEDGDAEPIVYKDVRLPRSMKPVAYDIVIAPDLSGENFTFKGDVVVKIHVDQSCTNISIHSWTLKINRNHTSIKVLNENGEVTDSEITVKNQYFIDEKQFLVIETNEVLEAGKIYLLKLKYVGQILDNLQGFYKSSYTVENQTKWLSSTQFQATDARRAFPW